MISPLFFNYTHVFSAGSDLPSQNEAKNVVYSNLFMDPSSISVQSRQRIGCENSHEESVRNNNKDRDNLFQNLDNLFQNLNCSHTFEWNVFPHSCCLTKQLYAVM